MLLPNISFWRPVLRGWHSIEFWVEGVELRVVGECRVESLRVQGSWFGFDEVRYKIENLGNF